MKEINLSFEIITPLVMSGANKNEVELREQSLKGILRWWFRFYKGAEISCFRDLREAEGKIWGSQEMASRIKILIENKNLSSKENENDYYAYLCMNDKNGKYSQIKRKAFKENQKFNVKFQFMPPYSNELEKNLEHTLFFLSNFGGLGARWRRGFGSIIIEGYHIDGSNLEEIKNNLNQKLQSFPISSNNNKDFINLSSTSIYLISPKNRFWNSWEETMNNLRDNFYRELKNRLNIRRIAIDSERAFSPLIIQIKKINTNYYGSILIWKKWEKYEEYINEMKKLDFLIKEVKI